MRLDLANDVPVEWLWHDMAPGPGCRFCAQTRDVFGRVRCGIGASYSEQRLAALLRMAGQHIHTCVDLNGREADVLLPLTPVFTVVENDGGWVHKMPKTIANEIVQRELWQGAGATVVRLREPGLLSTGPVDLALPRGINHINDWDLSALVLDHVLHHAGLPDAVVVAGVLRALEVTGCTEAATVAQSAATHRANLAAGSAPSC